MPASPEPISTPRVVGRRLARETTFTANAGASTLPGDLLFATFASPAPQEIKASAEAQPASTALPLSKSLTNKPTSLPVTKHHRTAKYREPSPPPASTTDAMPAGITVSAAAVTTSSTALHVQHSPPPRSDPSRDALRQLQTLQGLPTDRLLNINVRLDAKKSAHVPGFYGNPRTERARSAAAAAAIAPTTLTHERLNVDRDRVMANMVISSVQGENLPPPPNAAASCGGADAPAEASSSAAAAARRAARRLRGRSPPR